MFNKVILMGRLTKDPEMTNVEKGTTIIRFTVAIDRKYQKQGEEKKTDFLNIIVFGKTAEFVKKYFVKGQLMLVSGTIQTRSWDKDGQRHYATDIIGEEVNFAGGKNENNQDKNSDTQSNFYPIDDDALPWS